MYKIKDKESMKRLEGEFGYRNGNVSYMKVIEKKDTQRTIVILKRDRVIRTMEYYESDENIEDYIQDLINANLVEKVEE